MRTEARYGFTTEPYSGGGRQKEFGFMSPGNHGIIMQEDEMRTLQEMGKTIANLNTTALAMQTENRLLKSFADPDPLGAVGPRDWPKQIGFMDINTMQTACECQSFTNGVGEGVGIGVGIGVTAAVAWAMFSLLKKG